MKGEIYITIVSEGLKTYASVAIALLNNLWNPKFLCF